MERLGDFLFRHLGRIAAYCDHPVRFGVVESINTTIKAVLRRARGMRDEQMLLLKLKWTSAHRSGPLVIWRAFSAPRGCTEIGEEPSNVESLHSAPSIRLSPAPLLHITVCAPLIE
jgi:hypothetical protein